jgi:chromosome segregation ATPase
MLPKSEGGRRLYWLQRHAKWAWPIALVVGVLLVVGLRVWPGGSPRRASSDAGAANGVAAAQASDLASAARRIRFLQDQVNRTRQQLVSLQTEAAARRGRVAALDEMLATDSLAECPPFLRDDTTVRALQKIVREAADSTAAGTPGHDRLDTAASVARERLRSKLDALRDQLGREAADLDAQAETLRQRLQILTGEVEQLQRDIRRELQGRAGRPGEPVG